MMEALRDVNEIYSEATVSCKLLENCFTSVPHTV